MSGELNSNANYPSLRKIARFNPIDLEDEQVYSYLQDLEKSLVLNKQVLSDLAYTKLHEENSGNLILALIKEVECMENEYQLLLKECEDNQAKALIDEQIASEYNRKEQEFIAESEEKITDIIYQNDKKGKIIGDLSTKIKQLEDDCQLYKKSKNMIVVPPSEDIIDLHCQVEDLKSLLAYEARRLYSLQSKKEKLMESSEVLNKEVEKLKVLLKNPMNRKSGVEHSSSNLKSDISMEIIQDESEESDEFNALPLTSSPIKTKSQPLFELSLNRQHSISFDMLTLSLKDSEEDEKILMDIKEHIDAMKGEIQIITEQLVRVSKENESLLENNEKLANTYLKFYNCIDVSEDPQRKEFLKSKNSRSNSNINEEVFKFIDSNQISPRFFG